MPLTAAQRQAKRREKLRAEGKYHDYKSKYSLWKREQRKLLSNERKESVKLKDRERKAKCRKVRSDISQNVPEIDSNQTPSTPGPSQRNPFKTAQSLGKAKRKIEKVLPKSPRKRRFLLIKLHDNDKQSAKETQRVKGRAGRPGVTDDIKEAVHKHFMDDEVSWQTPGMKDFVLIKKGGEKIRVQKRYLLSTMEESFEFFKEKNPTIELSLSKFKELRPPYIYLQANTPSNVCVCRTHENVRFLLLTMSKGKPELKTSFQDFIAQIVCNQNSEKCMFGQCSECPGLDAFAPVGDELGELCTWYEWGSKEAKKVEVSGTLFDCYSALKEKLPAFLEHTFIKRQQAATFRTLKENLQEGTVVLQMDFSENYSCFEQNEIQAAHWAHKQLTLFTACAWFKSGDDVKCQSFALASEVLEHDKYFVNAAITKILHLLSEMNVEMNSVHFFTDGAASQFKQRYTLSNMTFLEENDIQAFWHFFATSHGKGAVDGVGGEVKRHARLASLSGRSVQSLQEFMNVAQEKCKRVCIAVVEREEIECARQCLQERWKDVDGVPAMQKMHYFETVQKNVVNYAVHSQCDVLRTHQFKSMTEPEAKEEETAVKCTEKVKIEKESYYAVFFDKRFYIGRVTDIPWIGKATLKFLHSSGTDSFAWPNRDDVATVKNNFVFFGPVTLTGNGPFKLKEHEQIQKLYDTMKMGKSMMM